MEQIGLPHSGNVDTSVTVTPRLQFFLNGKLVQEENPDPNELLTNYIRNKAGLTGTKVACGVGGCGSCTVILSKYDSTTKEFTHSTINSCITPVCSLHGCHILTVEGLSSGSNVCHPIQDALAQGNGTQCGFCSPGMVMSFYGLKQLNQSPTTRDIKTALQGNLCRCTGYRPIIEAFRDYCKQCPQATTSDAMEIEDLHHCASVIPQIEDKRHISLEPAVSFGTIEQLLVALHQSDHQRPNEFRSRSSMWLNPESIPKLMKMLAMFPNAQLVAGATEGAAVAGILTDNILQPKISLGMIPELHSVQERSSSLELGSMTTIAEMVKYLKFVENSLPAYTTSIFRATVSLMEYFGSTQIRNVATIGGSLATSNPASDFQTIFLGFGYSAEIIDYSDQRPETKIVHQIPPAKSVILKVIIPQTQKNEYAWSYKISKRKYNDSAIINMACLIQLEEDSVTFKRLTVAVGGKPIRRILLHLTPDPSQAKITGIGFTELLMNSVVEGLHHNLVEDTSFSRHYIQHVGKSLCIKFYNWLRKEVLGKNVPNRNMDADLKATRLFSGTENDNYSSNDLVGKPQPHASAWKHVTGQAQYVDDIPKYTNELALAFVTSTRAHARIKTICTTLALSVEGVVGYVSHKDVSSYPGQNLFGVIVEDEEVFASEKVVCFGQTIGGIVATNPEIARHAAKLVVVEYEDLLPCILTIPDAIHHKSFYSDFDMKLEKGNWEEISSSSDHVLTDFIDIGGQEHFYLEPQGSLAVPNGEDGEITLYSSAQHPSEVQHQVAKKLGIPANRVVVKVKRVGGGFGGKETRSMLVALPVAVAAHKFGKPVRTILDRQTDMLISGKRHPYHVYYSIAFTSEGKIKGLECKLYADGGCSLDGSPASTERALINLDNGYFLPAVKLEAYICKTNFPSNTVFRGTGAPQAAFIMEKIIDRVASFLNKDPVQIRRLNMYSEGDLTPYGQVLVNSTIRRCWDECLRLSKYYEQKSQVDEFNRTHLWLKRGISINPAQYGIGITALALNQAGALVHIYQDGSVVVNHGGVELGQGLHTKMIQVASRELAIPASKIRILETSTDKVPNTAPTAGSISSDINGMAVMYACQELRKRLQPYFDAESELAWENTITKAFEDRVSLSATGFYKTPNIGWKEVMRGNPFNYFSTGVACTMVELDCFTGTHQILKTDIVMDVGNSLNPVIDIGQIEGAFIQGVGLFTTEELKYDAKGKLVTDGPLTYKVPCITDTPLEFNISLLSNSPNPRAVYSSKAIGEPPLLLATSAFFAIKDAVEAYRKSSGQSLEFELQSPATVEKILLACSSEHDANTEHVLSY